MRGESFHGRYTWLWTGDQNLIYAVSGALQLLTSPDVTEASATSCVSELCSMNVSPAGQRHRAPWVRTADCVHVKNLILFFAVTVGSVLAEKTELNVDVIEVGELPYGGRLFDGVLSLRDTQCVSTRLRCTTFFHAQPAPISARTARFSQRHLLTYGRLSISSMTSSPAPRSRTSTATA